MPEEDSNGKAPPRRPPVWSDAPTTFWGAVSFGFGTAAGLLLAFIGLGLIERSLDVLLVVFLTALVVVSAFGVSAYLLRRRLLRTLFGFADTQLETFAGPLSEVARNAVDRDPQGATRAARELAQRALARYAWISTRRWVIGSLTALIAAMAALAGTALLFRQNELLASQLGALDIQNARIAEQTELLRSQTGQIEAQTRLLASQVELAEAARNAQLAVVVTDIAELLGRALDERVRKDAAAAASTARPGGDQLPVLDPVADIGGGLRMRIVAASRAARPYRSLKSRYFAYDIEDNQRVALARRPELFATGAAPLDAMGGGVRQGDRELIDRPLSPERGALLRVLLAAGVREFELLSFLGLDLSFADAADANMFGLSLQHAQLSYAKLNRSRIISCDLGGSSLENARLAGAVIRDSSFAAVTAETEKPPYDSKGTDISASLVGTSFAGAYVIDTSFAAAHALAADFDGAVLRGVSFREASLAAATFRGALLVDTDFTGASLKSVDLDRAVVFRGDFLEWLTSVSVPGTFRADRFSLEAASTQDVGDALPQSAYADADPFMALAESAGAWRVARTGRFGDGG